MQRRTFLKTTCGAIGFASFFSPSAVFAASSENLLGFEQIAFNDKDKFVVPQGYEAKPLISWGDALFSKASAFDEKKIIDQRAVENANLVFGDNNDGMALFELENGNALLAVNNEYINPEIMFSHKGEKTTLEDVRYMQNSLGVSIFEISKDKDGFFKWCLTHHITAESPLKRQ